MLNRQALLDAAGAIGLRLAREFIVQAAFAAAGAPEALTGHRGFLFTPRDARTSA